MATILIVDDRAINRDFLCTLLGYAGHNVVEASDGAVALAAVRRCPPDLVITDVLMPCMDGVEFARQLKADSALAAIPIIFYTATFRLGEARHLAASCGVTIVLAKPSEPQAILDTVAQTLGTGTAAASREATPPPPAVSGQSPGRLNRYDIQALGMRLATLLELGLALACERDTARLLTVACRGSQEIMRVRHAAIGLVDEHGRLQHLETIGLSSDARAALGTAAFAPDSLAAFHPPADTALAKELRLNHRQYGWLYLAGRVDGGGAFTAEDKQLAATLATKIALSWENLSLYEETRRAKEALQKGREELERRVQERTHELVEANLTLRFEMEVRARTETELRRSNAELEQFAYITAHDLQEPLRTVTSFLQLLAQRYGGRIDAEADRFIDFAVNGADRMRALIDGVLSYSQVRTAGRQAASPTDSKTALESAVANLQAAVTEARAEIGHDLLPQVLADPEQLIQLFQNLLDNALKFRGRAAPCIQVSARREGADWLFSVRDNGIGIDPRYHQRIFGIFQRLHGRDEYAGTGIGLALCQKIVDSHGGRLWVESTPGEGATFYFTLPGADASAS